MQNENLSEKFHAAIWQFDAPGYSFQVWPNARGVNDAEEFHVYTRATDANGKPISGRVRTEVLMEQEGRYMQVRGLPKEYIMDTLADTFIDALPASELEALRQRAAGAGMPLHKVNVHLTVRDYRGNVIAEDDTMTMMRAFDRAAGANQPDLDRFVELRLSPDKQKVEEILEGTFWGGSFAKDRPPVLEIGKNAVPVKITGDIVRTYDKLLERHNKPSPLTAPGKNLW